MTLTFELDLDMIKLNQAKYLSVTLFSLKVVTRTHTRRTDCRTW